MLGSLFTYALISKPKWQKSIHTQGDFKRPASTDFGEKPIAF